MFAEEQRAELAAVYGDSVARSQLLRRAGFPMDLMPTPPAVSTPRELWLLADVAMDSLDVAEALLPKMLSPDDLRACVLAQAHKDYPKNPFFKAS